MKKLIMMSLMAITILSVVACSADDGKDDPTPATAEAVFAAKLAKLDTPVIGLGANAALATTAAIISPDGKTISATLAAAFGGANLEGDTWKLFKVDTTANTATYTANGTSSVATTDLVLTFTDIDATAVVLATTGGGKYGAGTAVDSVLFPANALIKVVGAANTLKLTSGATLSGAFNAIDNQLEVVSAGAIVGAFGADTAGAYTMTTTLTAIAGGGVKAVMVLTKASGNMATGTLARDTITVATLATLTGNTLTKGATANSVSVAISA